MKRAWFLLLASALLVGNAWAQATGSASGQASASADAKASAGNKKAEAKASGGGSADASTEKGKTSASLASGSTFEAVLSHPVDARKNKAGDEVVARSAQNVKSDGKVIIPKGSKLVGHVTEAKARAKGESESALGIMFDRAVLKNGEEVPLHAVIQAVSAAQSQAALSGGDDEPLAPIGGGGSVAGSGSGRASASGGGLLGGATSAVGATAGAVTSAAGGVGQTAGGAVSGTVNSAASATTGVNGLGANGLLTSTSTGVFGLQGMTLNSQTANTAQGSLLVSSTKNVHLDSGTRMMLRAENQQ